MSSKKRPRRGPTVKKVLPHTQHERRYAVAKKVLRHFEIDPELLNVFTKKQIQLFLLFPFELPAIKAEKENSIPRRYVEKLREEILAFMKTNFFGNPENELTYMELVTSGLGFYFSVCHHVKQGVFAGTPQEATALQIYDVFVEKDFLETDYLGGVLFQMKYLTAGFSQVNFRLYGFYCAWEKTRSKTPLGYIPGRLKIWLTVRGCESKTFVHNNIERKAFRMILSADHMYDFSPVLVRRDRIFAHAKEHERLNLYIQSHALHRFKERMNICSSQSKNYLLQFMLTSRQRVIDAGKQMFLACCLADHYYPVGYFTFFIQGDDLVVQTFLPLSNEHTPEGQKLHKLLPLENEDMVYLGIDKLRFYLQIDFDQIPLLKQALVNSGIWQMKEYMQDMIGEESLEEEGMTIDENKTLFVKQFFDKYEQHRKQVLNNETILNGDDI